jgi:transcriptional antiterminator
VKTQRGLEQKVRTHRILTIDRLIQEGTYPNTQKLAEKFEVTTSTIQRDIEYLRNMYGAPIEYDPIRRGFYYSEPNFFILTVLNNRFEVSKSEFVFANGIYKTEFEIINGETDKWKVYLKSDLKIATY